MKRAAALLIAVTVLFAAAALLKSGSSDLPDGADSAALSAGERDRVLRFWETYRRATEYRIAGAAQRAAAEYASALELDPEHHDALYYLGNMEFELGHFAAAERAWQRLIGLEPTSARAHSQLGMLYFCTGGDVVLEPERAVLEFRRAAAINPEETGPLLSLGEIALVRGALDTAQGYFDAVIGSNYTSVAAHFYEGYIAWKTGAPSRAAELLSEAARHTAPVTSRNDTSREGDTRTGARPPMRAPHPCAALRTRAQELAAVEGDVAGQVAPVYQAFDALLREVRAKLP
jgi:tetratricopeptide (TPR) repeat protein